MRLPSPHQGYVRPAVQAQSHEPVEDVTSQLRSAVLALKAELRRRVDAASAHTPRQARPAIPVMSNAIR